MIVDNDNILSALKSEYAESDSIVIPIYSDIRKHRVVNQLSLLYIYIINTQKQKNYVMLHVDAIVNYKIILIC